MTPRILADYCRRLPCGCLLALSADVTLKRCTTARRLWSEYLEATDGYRTRSERSEAAYRRFQRHLRLDNPNEGGHDA